MLENWLNPINEDLKDFCLYYPLGKNANFFSKDKCLTSQEKFAILSSDDLVSCRIREKFYQLGNFQNSSFFVDLGFLKKSNNDFIHQVLNELIDSNLTPICLGIDSRIISSYVQTRGWKQNQILTNSIGNFINQITPSKVSYDFIGFQKHLSEHLSSENENISQKNSLNLGRLKKNIGLSEILLRHADSVNFDLAILKRSENPGNPYCRPNGLTTEEACILANYVGLSNNLKLLNFSGVHSCDNETEICAELLWYYLNGTIGRIKENPSIKSPYLKEILVESDNIDFDYSFIKSTKTGRFWIKLDNIDEIIPCSELEYQQVMEDNFPQRIMDYIEAVD